MNTPQLSKEELLAKMDAAAEDAKKEFNSIKGTGHIALDVLSGWWKRWYPKAGHKRLGRILMNGGKQ